MLDLIRNELLELLATLAISILAVGAAYAIAYLRRAREALEARVDNELAEKVLGRVWHLAEVAVLATESTTAAALRQAVAEGRASREELVALGRQVVDQVLAQLDDEARLALAETVGDIRRYVESIVEATLERLKAEGVVARVSELAAPKSSSPSPDSETPQPA